MEQYIITLDIGGTQIKYGAVSPTGKMLKAASVDSRNNSGPEELLERITACIDETRRLLEGEPAAIGLGLSGGIDPEKGVVLLPGKFKALEGFPLVSRLREKYGLPVWADNDGRLAAYAEKNYGAAREEDWVVVFTIGTGVGSGVVLGGRILADPHLMAGTQIGHLVMAKSDDRICLTGNPGTGEILCSSTALALQVRSAIQRGLPCLLTDSFYQDPRSIDFGEVVAACRQGDPLCLREMEVWTENVALMIINAVHAYAPETIVLCGGATYGADLFLEKLRNIVNRQVFRYPSGRTIRIVVSELHEYAGMLGAAAMIAEKLNL